MTEYRFLTFWYLEAPLKAVWDAVYDPARWPVWWEGVERVEALEPGDPHGVGSLHRYTWKSRLPYRIRFDLRVTRVEPLVCLAGVASGQVEGTGCWTFAEGAGVAVVRYEWQVRTLRRWMNLLAPVARPLFRWNHDAVMAQGGAGLARRVGGRLLQVVHG